MKFLYRAHGKLVSRIFDGRGLSFRHRIALAVVRIALDVKECGLSALNPREWWHVWERN